MRSQSLFTHSFLRPYCVDSYLTLASQWLVEQGVPGVYGIDTRALTKRLRDSGSMLGRLVYASPEVAAKQEVEFEDPNARCVLLSFLSFCFSTIEAVFLSLDVFLFFLAFVYVLSVMAVSFRNLVAEVSIRAPVTYIPIGACGRLIKIIAVHCGMKNNIIRHFIKLGVELKVVPWDFDFTNEDYDGMFFPLVFARVSLFEYDTVRKVQPNDAKKCCIDSANLNQTMWTLYFLFF